MIWAIKKHISRLKLSLLMLIICINVTSQNLKCDDIKWTDYKIKSDSIYAYNGKIKLAEINENIFNKVNYKIIKKIFIRCEKCNEKHLLSNYFLGTSINNLKPKFGFTEFVTNVYCTENILSYQIQSYTVGAKHPNYKYLNYNFNKEKDISVGDIVIESKKETFKKFMHIFLNNNKREIIKNLRKLLSETNDIFSLSYLEVLNDSGYNFDNIHIKNDIDLKYFNSKGIVFGVQFQDLNLLKIESYYESEKEINSYILIPYKKLKDFVHSEFVH